MTYFVFIPAGLAPICHRPASCPCRMLTPTADILSVADTRITNDRQVYANTICNIGTPIRRPIGQLLYSFKQEVNDEDINYVRHEQL